MPDSDVTVHRRKVHLTHPEGPDSVLFETFETHETRRKGIH